jgi:hypothetical protein
MYASLDLHQRIVHAVLKNNDGNVVKEARMKKETDGILHFLDGTNAKVVMESGYNYQYLYDLLKEEGYDVQFRPSFE